MKPLALFAVLFTGALLLFSTKDFPYWADPLAPAAVHPSVTHYLSKGVAETETPNIVTAILADYRSFDTMLETVVVFTAGIAIILLLRLPPRARRALRSQPILPIHRDLITETTCRILYPMIQLFALYVLAHGHYSPGGGFQGGVILGASFILVAIAFDLRTAIEKFPSRAQTWCGVLGLTVYLGVGILCMALGGNLLEYNALASVLPLTPAKAHSVGILLVETGVLLTVSAIMFSIYVDLSSHGKHIRGL